MSTAGKVFLVIGIIGLVIVLLVGGCIAVGFYFMGQASDRVAAAVADDPAVVEHIGEIRECDVSFPGIAAEAERHPQGEPKLVFELIGTKGRGVLTTPADAMDPSRPVSGILRLPSGQEVLVGEVPDEDLLTVPVGPGADG